MIMQNKPQSLKHVLKSVMHERGWGEKFAEADVNKVWQEVVGPRMAAVARIEKLDEGVLYLLTRSSTWRTELLLRREKLIEELNSKLNNIIIKDIIIR
jgi:predicted nucleic acid-binding Zn ribbon protein